MAQLPAITRASIYASALDLATGYKPNVKQEADHVLIYWNQQDEKILAERFIDLVESEPGDVRIRLNPIVRPYYIRKGLPWLVGAFILGYLLG